VSDPAPDADPTSGSLFRAVGDAVAGKRGPGRPRKVAAAPKAAKPKATPPPAKQRKSMEQSFTLIYGLGGAALEQRGVRLSRYDSDGRVEQVWQPSLAGRAMKLQSPMAGKELSDWVNGIGWLSALLGPVLGNESFTVMAKVVGLPLMMHVLQVRPESAPMIQPLVMPMLTDLYVGLKREQAKQTAAMEALSDLDENARDEFQQWAESIFAVQEVVIAQDEPAPEPEPIPEPAPEPVRVNPSDDGFGQIDADLGVA